MSTPPNLGPFIIGSDQPCHTGSRLGEQKVKSVLDLRPFESSQTNCWWSLITALYIPVACYLLHNCGVQIILIKYKNNRKERVCNGTLVSEAFLDLFCMSELFV